MTNQLRVCCAWTAIMCGLPMAIMPQTVQGQTGIAPNSLFSTITVIDISGYPEIVFFTTLQDTDGRNIEVCGAEAFSLRSYHTNLGALRDVADLEVTLLPTLPGTAISVVLVMDTSGSLRGTGIEQSKAAAREFVNSLQPQDRAAIVTFDDDVKLLQPFTNDHNLLNAAVDQQRASGDTSLYDGILEGLLEASREPGNRNIIVFSDGKGNDSVADQADVISEAKRLLIPVHTIAVGNSDEEELRDIAQGTNGTFREGELGRLGQLYIELTTQIRSQYRLVFTSPHGGADSLHRELQLHVQCAGLDTYANTGYLATPPLRLTPTTATSQLIETNQSVAAGADVVLAITVSGNPSEVRLLYRQVGTDTFQELAMTLTGGTIYEPGFPR